MIIEIKKNVDNTTIEVSGRLDTTTAPILEKTINENLNDIKLLVLDFKNLVYISNAGLRVLLTAQRKMKSDYIMEITNVCDEIMSVFKMNGFVDILTIV